MWSVQIVNNNYYSPMSYENILDNLAERVKQLRDEKNLTQEDMMDNGMSLRSYQNVERNVSKDLKLKTLHQIAKRFNISLSELFEGL